jgi:hypothetical protein
MGSQKIAIKKKLSVAFIGIFVICFMTGFTPLLDTQACLPNYIQIEFCERDEEDIRGDNLPLLDGWTRRFYYRMVGRNFGDWRWIVSNGGAQCKKQQ